MSKSSRKPRDSKAEYARRKEKAALQGTTPYAIRKERATQKGYSVSQARGHARTGKGELPISIAKTIPPLSETLHFPAKAKTSHRVYEFTYKTHDPGIYNTAHYLRDDATRAYVVIQFPLKDGSEGEAQTRSISLRGGSGIADLYDEVQKLLAKYDIRSLPGSVRNKLPMFLHLVTPEPGE